MNANADSYPTAADSERLAIPQSDTNLAMPERALSVLAGVITIVTAIRNRSLWSGIALLPAAYLIKRGVTGYCEVRHALGMDAPSPAESSYSVIEKTVSVNRSVAEVFATFRDFRALAHHLKHLNTAERIDGSDSRWRLEVEARLPILKEWRVEITQEIPNELIAWRSLPDSTVDTRGSIRFETEAYDRGTTVHLTVAYRPRLPFFGWLAEKQKGIAAQQLKEELVRIKQLLETGEIARTEGQPQGGLDNPRGALDGLNRDDYTLTTTHHTNGHNSTGGGD